MVKQNIEKIYEYESHFNDKYIADIKKEFERFKKDKKWNMLGGELICPIMFIEDKKLKYDKISIWAKANPIITSPFKATILSLPGFYNPLIHYVRKFILPFKESLDKKIKDSFTIEIAKGKIIEVEALGIPKEKIWYKLDFE